MSKLSFVYCFSKKLAANEEQYTINLLLLKKSIEHIKKLYDYRIITDEQTIDDVKALSDNIEIVNSDNYIFLEDIKTSLVSSLTDNELIVDPDLFIYRELGITLDYDIIFEHIDIPTNPWYSNYIEGLKGTLLYDRILSAGKIPFVPNIGFFRIMNSNLQSDFLQQYSIYRENILSKNLQNPNQYNLLLGQYLLGIVLYEGNYSYLNTSSINKGEVYHHFAGPNKYRKFKVNKPVI